MKDPHDIVVSMMRTEKGSAMLPLNKYQFLVSRDSNKVEIRAAIETIYKVKVSAVNTSNVMGKMRRVRYQIGKRPDWKKAIVTLKEGSKIDIT